MRDVTDNVEAKVQPRVPGLVKPDELWHGEVKIGTRIAGSTVITHPQYTTLAVPDTQSGKIRMRIFRK